MRILVLGSGAKDHAAAWWISRSAYISKLFMAPGNPGTADMAVNLEDLDNSDPEAVFKAVEAHRIDAVFIGTEAPLVAGVREYLVERGVTCFGASREALRLEDDKAFSRAFTQRHGIPMPKGTLFHDEEALAEYLDANPGIKYTIKSNVMAPSRVVVSSREKEFLLSYARMLFGKGPVLLETTVPGVNVTATILMDNEGYLLLPLSSEYRNVSKLQGTPTGGMGAIAPIPLKDESRAAIRDRIIEPTLRAMKEEGISYKGILTLSMVLSEDGPVLVDYHVRLNDPATQAMVPIVTTDFVAILRAMEEDRVNTVRMETTSESTVAVVLAAPGYPVEPLTGEEIGGIDYSFLMDIREKPLVFVGAMEKNGDGKYLTAGGRCITVVGRGQSLEEANMRAYEIIRNHNISTLWYRDDIGNRFFSSQD